MIENLQISYLCLGGIIFPGFFCDFFDLAFDFFVFSEFPFQEVCGYSGFFFEAVGRQHVGVGDFVSGTFESFDFDDPLVGQFCEDVVGFAQADAHPAGHLPLGETGVVGQDFEDFVAYFLLVVMVHGANIRLVGVGCQGEFIGGER
jgi:hypothetical protein